MIIEGKNMIIVHWKHFFPHNCTQTVRINHTEVFSLFIIYCIYKLKAVRYLRPSFSALRSHLVGQSFGHVGSLLGLLQVVLGLPEPGHVHVALLLLQINHQSRWTYWRSDTSTEPPDWFLLLIVMLWFTHGFFGLSLVSFHLVLQLVDQILQPHVVFLVLLSLKTVDRSS